MEFKNDLSKINNEMFDSMKHLVFKLYFSILAMSSAIYFNLEESGALNIGLILVFVFMLMATLVNIFLFFLYKYNKSRYINFILDVQENYITERYSDKNIELNNDCMIVKYKNGNISIKNSKKEIYISKYINNKIELENKLSFVNSINAKNQTLFSKFINLFVFAFFVHYIFLFLYVSLELHLFLGLGFIFTAIISIICSIIYKKNNVLSTISIIIKVLFIIIYSIYILDIIIY
jgi:hypothetical protein